MAGRNDGNITLEGATIMFRNFQGKESMFNQEGNRNFCVQLDDGLAEVLDKDGWNVKQMKIREEGDDPQKFLKVSLKYRDRAGNPMNPPTIVMVTSKGRTNLTENEIEILDWVDIANVDLIIRPYEWAMQGKSGVTAYVKSLYITIAEDELERKYAALPDSRAQVAIGTGPEVWDAEVVEEDEQKALES